MTSKFEKELINTANFLSNDKIKVVAVYTECWKGLSINSKDGFEKYLQKLQSEQSKRLNCFNNNGEQVSLVANYDLRFPVRIDNIKSLDSVHNFALELSKFL